MKDKQLAEAFLALIKALEASLIDPNSLAARCDEIKSAPCQPAKLPHNVVVHGVTGPDKAYELAREYMLKEIMATGKDNVSLVVLSEEEYFKLGLLLIEANEMCRSALSIAKRQGRETNWEAFEKKMDASLRKQFVTVNGFKCKHCYMPLSKNECTNPVCNQLYHHETKSPHNQKSS